MKQSMKSLFAVLLLTAFGFTSNIQASNDWIILIGNWCNDGGKHKGACRGLNYSFNPALSGNSQLLINGVPVDDDSELEENVDGTFTLKTFTKLKAKLGKQEFIAKTQIVERSQIAFKNVKTSKIQTLTKVMQLEGLSDNDVPHKKHAVVEGGCTDKSYPDFKNNRVKQDDPKPLLDKDKRLCRKECKRVPKF